MQQLPQLGQDVKKYKAVARVYALYTTSGWEGLRLTDLGLVLQLEGGLALVEAAAPLHGPHHGAPPVGAEGGRGDHLVHVRPVDHALLGDVPHPHLHARRPASGATQLHAACLQQACLAKAARTG